MTILYTQYTLLIIFSLLFLHFRNQCRALKKEIDRLKKLTTGKLTDIEKLETMIKIYNEINFKNLRPDQLKNWCEIIKTWYCSTKKYLLYM